MSSSDESLEVIESKITLWDIVVGFLHELRAKLCPKRCSSISTSIPDPRIDEIIHQNEKIINMNSELMEEVKSLKEMKQQTMDMTKLIEEIKSIKETNTSVNEIKKLINQTDNYQKSTSDQLKLLKEATEHVKSEIQHISQSKSLPVSVKTTPGQPSRPFHPSIQSHRP